MFPFLHIANPLRYPTRKLLSGIFSTHEMGDINLSYRSIECGKMQAIKYCISADGQTVPYERRHMVVYVSNPMKIYL